MTLLALIRHGATSWNAEGRIQGRSDVALSPEGVAELKRLRAPPMLDGAVWLTSPLRRARQTAAILNGVAADESLLIETNWGAWEGLESQITKAMAARIAARGAAGLDFRPPGGESPREVQDRLRRLFASPALPPLAAAVTHKGVIRAALSLATGWDMLGKPPVKLAWRAAHLFDIAADGAVSLTAANVALEPRR